MKIILKDSGEVLASIIGGEKLTLDEACDLMEIKVMRTAEDYELGNGYDFEELLYVDDNFKRIYCGAVRACANTVDEYQIEEKTECEHGIEWEGNVQGYVANLDLDDGCEVSETNNFAIHNEPEDAILIVCNGSPVEIYWAE